MNDQRLRERMHTATEEIRPRSRLAEIEATAPPVDLASRRRPPLLAAAAVVLVVLLGAAVVSQAGSGSDSSTKVQSRPPQAVPSSTIPDPDAGRVGDKISVLESTLPAGVHLIDEQPRISGEGLTLIARYALGDVLWDGDGPYLRIIVQTGPDYGTWWAGTERGEAVSTVGGRDVYRLASSPTGAPTPAGGGASLDKSWSTLSWSPDPDQIIEVQTKGIDPDIALDVAHGVRIRH